MSEVTAQMIEQGRGGDPAAAARRRKMNIKLRHARQTLTSAAATTPEPYDSLVRLFAQSAKQRDARDRAADRRGRRDGLAALGAAAPRGLLDARSPLTALALRYSASASAYLRLPDPEQGRQSWRALLRRRGSLFRRAPGRCSLCPAAAIAGSRRAAVSPSSRCMLVAGIAAMAASAIPAAVAVRLCCR